MIETLSATHLALVVVSYLLAKHMLADFVLQTRYQYENKGTYGHVGGLLHAAIHALLSVPLLIALLGRDWSLVAALAMAEFVIHYHIDYAKEQVTRRQGLTSQGQAYWVLFGLDQLAHHATYIAGAAYLLA